MLELIRIFITFLKLALFNFGGGYAMIALITKEVLSNNWISMEELNNIIVISEMTPGPIAVNAATFVGFKVQGFWGAFFATMAIPIPSFILVILFSDLLKRYKDHPIYKTILYGIKPVIVGLIVSAAFLVSKSSILKGLSHNVEWTNPMNMIDLKSLIIFIVSLVLLMKFKLHPILLIIIAGVSGYLLY